MKLQVAGGHRAGHPGGSHSANVTCRRLERGARHQPRRGGVGEICKNFAKLTLCRWHVPTVQFSFMDDQLQIRATIRSYRAEDQAACSALYIDGLIGGKIAENDTGYDIDHIQQAYMTDGSGSHFWVAESPSGQIVGTIGVQHLEDGVGEIKRLRVRSDYRRRGIGTALLETALKFCQDKNYLKVTLDTYVERGPALKLFEKFQFHISRTRAVGEKELVYFYLDIYAGDLRRRHPLNEHSADQHNAEMSE